MFWFWKAYNVMISYASSLVFVLNNTTHENSRNVASDFIDHYVRFVWDCSDTADMVILFQDNFF